MPAPTERPLFYHWIDVVYERLETFWEGEDVRRGAANFLVAVFIGTLILVELKINGLLPSGLSDLAPKSHFAAVSFAFTAFLIIEIIGLVFALARSVARAVGKQFEIFSLILLREAFKEFSYFAEPIVWEQIRTPVLHMMADAVGALAVFLVVAFFYRAQKHFRITADEREQSNFVTAKKGLALVLLLLFAGVGAYDVWLLTTGGETYPFFDTFYTILIFSDVLIVLLSLRYTATYHVVFRNSGFALATVALRIALAAPAYVNAIIGVGAALFVVGLTYAYNTFVATDVAKRVETAETGSEEASEEEPLEEGAPEEASEEKRVPTP